MLKIPKEEVYAHEQVALDDTYSSERKQSMFRDLSSIKDSDNGHLKYVKSKIDKLVAQELDYLNFKDKLSEEEAAGIAAKSYDDIITKSNFYFAIDEGKKERNVRVVNPKAPGNIHRHPSIGMPHGKVDIEKYVDTKDMDREKLMEMYAHHSHLIDLHISQVRPDNIKDKSYIPKQFN